MTTTLNESIERIQNLLPNIPEGLTEQQLRTGIANKLIEASTITQEMAMLTYDGHIPIEDAAAMFFTGALNLAKIAGKSLEEVAEYAANLVTQTKED